MNVVEFLERVFTYNPEVGEEALVQIILNLCIKGYTPNEIYGMTMDEAMFLLDVPFNKPYRRGTTTWGSHLANG